MVVVDTNCQLVASLGYERNLSRQRAGSSKIPVDRASFLRDVCPRCATVNLVGRCRLRRLLCLGCSCFADEIVLWYPACPM
ncbi:MAG: hypothetical protein JWM11_5049 [Planctomycetaceae bacterium]|nr:hypothetical protein [Planctomycetaceae bacterium]